MTPFTVACAVHCGLASADPRIRGGDARPRNHTDEIATGLSRWRAIFQRMSTEYDPQREAEAAMKQAVASEGADRQRLIQLALAWHQLARERRDEQAG